MAEAPRQGPGPAQAGLCLFADYNGQNTKRHGFSPTVNVANPTCGSVFGVADWPKEIVASGDTPVEAE